MPRPLHRLVLAGLLLFAGCRTVSYDAERAQKLQRVAIVVRVLGSATAELPEAARAGKTPQQLGKQIEKAMTPFEVAERLRSGLIEHLPDAPPWNGIVPGAQADTALGDMLTVDHPVQAPEFDELLKLGVDGVLYVQIDRWGALGDEAGSGFHIQGTGRLFTLPDQSTLWKGPLEVTGGGPLAQGWTEPGEVREHLGEVCARGGEQLALELGGSSQSIAKTPALDAPELEDKGHPPEKRKAIIPFAVPETDGGAPRDGGAGIDISTFQADGGELPTPGR
jgi:hypothetical protein